MFVKFKDEESAKVFGEMNSENRSIANWMKGRGYIECDVDPHDNSVHLHGAPEEWYYFHDKERYLLSMVDMISNAPVEEYLEEVKTTVVNVRPGLVITKDNYQGFIDYLKRTFKE